MNTINTINTIKGTYTIKVQHLDSNAVTPDYDYLAEVTQKNGNATVTIEDPEGLLGNHGESSFDFAEGKEASMIVASVGGCQSGSTDPACFCPVLRTRIIQYLG